MIEYTSSGAKDWGESRSKSGITNRERRLLSYEVQEALDDYGKTRCRACGSYINRPAYKKLCYYCEDKSETAPRGKGGF